MYIIWLWHVDYSIDFDSSILIPQCRITKPIFLFFKSDTYELFPSFVYDSMISVAYTSFHYACTFCTLHISLLVCIHALSVSFSFQIYQVIIWMLEEISRPLINLLESTNYCDPQLAQCSLCRHRYKLSLYDNENKKNTFLITVQLQTTHVSKGIILTEGGYYMGYVTPRSFSLLLLF